jgi:hypothetical protein
VRARIERANLRDVPHGRQVLDVVVHQHIRFQNLAAAGIGDVRPLRIFNGRREPAHHRITDVFGIPVWIFIVARGVARNDGIRETGRLERGLPVLDALADEWHQFRRCRRIDVVDDRLHGIGEQRRRILLLEPVARDERPFDGARFGTAEIKSGIREIADARIVQSRHHRRVG